LDQHGATAQAFGFKAVPNGVLVDATGIIRWTKFGGFSVDKPDDVATVERFLTGEEIEAPLARESAYELGENERELVATKLRLGHLLHAHGKTRKPSRNGQTRFGMIRKTWSSANRSGLRSIPRSSTRDQLGVATGTTGPRTRGGDRGGHLWARRMSPPSTM
jgi:hypothetical protein